MGMVGESMVKNTETAAKEYLMENYTTMDKGLILPLMYNLGITPTSHEGNTILQYLNQNPFNPSVLTGEVMLENIIMFDRASLSQYMRSATNHLFYRTNDILPEQDLLSDFITSMSKNINIDLLAVGNFLLNYRH